jgi:hypothetical protein
MATARQSEADQRVNGGRAIRAAGTVPKAYLAASASRNCRFSTLPLALRGKGCAVKCIVSGTL